MADSKKTYWKGLEELTNELEFVKNAHTEFGPLPSDDVESSNTTRRDFLKTLGFSVAAVSLAACEAPVRKAIPLLAKPEEYDPSIPNFYASSFIEGGDYASILVKTREGRPIKIEGNNISSLLPCFSTIIVGENPGGAVNALVTNNLPLDAQIS